LPGPLAINDDDVSAVPGQPFGNESAGNAGTDDENIAPETSLNPAAAVGRLTRPRRVGTAQFILP
jgi:hypothetical protein